ncbi:hypothetical protein B566_EDAN006552 [Ephemera danica]|nr:hypothetical protein B566_EDAN006552 [Ephemera danica]
MPKNGYQPTIPALLSRKRRLDDHKEEATQKRRSIAGQSSSEPETIVILETPEKNDRPETPEETSPVDRLAEVTFSRFRDLSCCPLTRASPLPRLKWAESDLLWKSLMKQDLASKSQRSEEMFARNPQVQPRMRSILLDWLIEVADVYKLHRETYYLAQDYVDRVLLVRKDTPKQELQLLGITCLFLAAKVEEIYPPKVAEFAYVTDGACSEAAILEHEMTVLTALEWELCPLTPAGWLRFYLQLACQQGHVSTRSNKGGSDFEYPRFPASALPIVSKLLDLATLDAGCVNFTYSMLAAAAFALVPCVAWMAPFAVALSSHSTSSSEVDGQSDHVDEEITLKPELKFTPTVLMEDAHNLQGHTVSMELLTLLNDSSKLAEDPQPATETSLQTPCNKPRPQPEETPEGLLTPPASRSKVLSDVTSKTANTNTGLKPTELFSPLTPNT